MEFETDDWAPRLHMEFQTKEQAWSFWRNYSGKMGFGVRDRDMRKSRHDGAVTSLVFVCSNEGKRRKDKRDDQTKNPRAETRTGCSVRLQLKLVREISRYKVVEFVSEHNHPLQKPEARYLLPSQRELPEVVCREIDLTDDSGIQPKEAHELMGREAGGITNLGYTIRDHRNYLRDKRQRALNSGVAVAMMNYFHRRVSENESFVHFEQIDESQEITNIFWADAKMRADFARFGDVVAFDTTFGTNKEFRPFGVFVGLNQFREIVIFGATLMYDQTADSFEWVFKTFLEAHNHKKMKTLFTDQDKAMGIALEKVMPEVKHALCVWHINENCTKHLSCYNKDGINVLAEFKACMYEYEEEDEFEKAFNDLKGKVNEKVWLPFIYACKEKWAYCYMKNAVTLGMRSTQLSESINKDLKRYLNSNMDIIRFLHHFERVINDKRENEIISEYEMTKKLPKIKLNIPILNQVAYMYTPKIFEKFQKQMELSLAAEISGPLGNEYTVAMFEFGDADLSQRSRKVVWNRDDQMVQCACKKFERTGILCWHALKVLDRENIKRLPQQYILKRWTREAINEIVQDTEGRTIVEDTTLDMTRRKKEMSYHFNALMAMASKNEEGTQFVNSALQTLYKQYEERFGNTSRITNDPSATTPIPNLVDNIAQNIPILKKKEGKRGSKRTKPWNEKMKRTNKRKVTHISTSQAKETSEEMPSTGYYLSQDHLDGISQDNNSSCFIDIEDKWNVTIIQ